MLKKFIAITFVGSVLALAFNNCQGTHSGTSQVSEEAMILCESDLQTNFKNTFYGFASKPGSCVTCHGDGGVSPVSFASQDLNLAFKAFHHVGYEKFMATAVAPTHAPGITGAGLQSSMDTLKMFWDLGYNDFLACAGGSTYNDPNAFEVAPQQAPEIYFDDNATKILVWDLTDPTIIRNGRGPLNGRLSIAVKINYQTVNGILLARGYTFSNPTLQVFDGERELQAEGIYVKVNDQIITGLDGLAAVTGIARGIDPKVLGSGNFIGLVDRLRNVDSFGIYVRRLVSAPRTDNPPTPPTPTMTSTQQFTNDGTVNFTIGGDGTARRWCVSLSPTPPASTSETCPGALAVGGTVNGWFITRPNNIDLNNLATLVSGSGYTLRLWIADSNLKISAGSPSISTTFDNVRPSSPTLAVSFDSSTATGIQFATVNITNNANEPVTYCIRESRETETPSANGCSFQATPPIKVALTGGGTRNIAAFVRDQAGNVSQTNNNNPVNLKQVNNTLGKLTYTQLMDPSNNARSVLSRQCASCHTGSGSGVSKLNIADYSSLSAKKDLVLGRIDNASSPMPQSGLMSQQDRDMLKLWFNTGAPY